MATSKEQMWSVLLVGMVMSGAIAPQKPSIAAANAEIAVQTQPSAVLPEKPIDSNLIAGRWDWLGKAMKILFGAIPTVVSVAPEVRAMTNHCSGSQREFPVRNYNTWYGHFNGYALGLSDQGYLAVSYPNGDVKTTENVYRSPRNRWFTLVQTPYAYCINGSNSIVRARFE